MNEKFTPTVEADPHITLERFLASDSSEERIKIAEDYIQIAEGVWLSIYADLAAAPEIMGRYTDTVEVLKDDLRKKYSTEINKEKPKERKEKNVVDAMTLLVQAYSALDRIEKSEDRPADFESAAPNLKQGFWLDFIDKLDIDTTLVKSERDTTEILNWFREKIERGRVVVFDYNYFEDPTHREKLSETMKSMGSGLILAHSRTDQDEEPYLFVNVELLDYQMSGTNLLIGLAHEKAHEDLLKYRWKHPSSLGDTEIVFQEFYPMLEELRTFRFFSEDDQNKAKSITQERHGYQESSYPPHKITLKSTNISSKYTYGKIVDLLVSSFAHSLQQEIKREKSRTLDELLLAGEDPEEIKKRIEEIKIMGTPVITWDDLKLEALEDGQSDMIRRD